MTPWQVTGFSSLALVQVVVWLREGSSITSRERNERCCDEKRRLVRCAEQILERERGRGESCCEVMATRYVGCSHKFLQTIQNTKIR